ncbi:MAG: serine hydrolase domain-containing protein [Parasphingopyxis sp.]|uniref:serine hydrolase domain-containing protein n=1 Tax=Parasphingopyxis sp. TaxID=1920299 RepID=UPI003F9F077F
MIRPEICRTLIAVLSLLAGSTGAGATAQDPTNTTSAPRSASYAELESQIVEWLERYDTPSVSVAWIENRQIVWSGTFGQQGPSQPADAETLYDTASLGKPITAEIVLRLAAEGSISLDEPMASHWLDPDIADDPRAQLLTPRHVLTHQTGLPNWRYLTDDVLVFQSDPGASTRYSGEGMQYLVRFVEAKLGRQFEDIAEELLLSPLGMTDTSLVRRDWFEGRMAWRYFPDGEWREPTARDEPLGAGEVHTNARDYARFIVGVMNDQEVSEELAAARYAISREQRDSCLEREAVPEACPDHMGFGLGWYVYDYGDETLVAHSGANAGERSLTVFSPDRGYGFVAFANGANGDHVFYEIAARLGIRHEFVEIERPEQPFGAAE